MSPSMRREWIEMNSQKYRRDDMKTSPSMRREWIEMNEDLITYIVDWSPSMRREWIEIAAIVGNHFLVKVSLHAEGVD